MIAAVIAVFFRTAPDEAKMMLFGGSGHDDYLAVDGEAAIPCPSAIKAFSSFEKASADHS